MMNYLKINNKREVFSHKYYFINLYLDNFLKVHYFYGIACKLNISTGTFHNIYGEFPLI